MAFNYENINIDLIRELFYYNHETGELTRRDSKNTGTPDGNGYLVFNINKKIYPAHKLAWLYVNGSLPIKGCEIDHINQNRSDNRIVNLRIVTKQENKFNTKARGCYQIKDSGRWRARIRVNGRYHSLGCYDTMKEAHQAYKDAKPAYHKIGA